LEQSHAYNAVMFISIFILVFMKMDKDMDMDMDMDIVTEKKLWIISCSDVDVGYW
jgi:hypothetical protein